jgi:hypothetical protein
MSGEIGQEYILEGASDINSPTNWQFLLSLTLTNSVQHWLDSESTLAARRFYRLARLTNSTPPATAQNFRLIDHLGKSRELYYYTNRAIVLIFTGNGCAKIQQLVATIKSLRDQFASSGVLFWMIDSNSQDTRSNIVVEATASAIDLPILHDEAQLVAREYGATKAPEILAIDTATWTIFYRGAIDDRTSPTAQPTVQSYLADALANFVADQTVTPWRTVPKGCDITLSPVGIVSYSTDIAPLLLNKCARCHSPGNIAPWAMTNYAIVRGYALSIKNEVLAGRMPPWHADPYYGAFTNDASLGSDEARRLIQWINEGAPRGTGADPLVGALTATNYPFAWPPELGQPDSVVSIPLQDIPPTGDVDYRYITVASPFANDVWLRAAVVRPGNVKVVHHSLVFNGSSSQLMGLDGFFTGYVPGTEPTAFPPETGKLLRQGEQLTFQMHYITTGRPETDQTQLGFYVMASQPANSLQTRSAFNPAFVLRSVSIPPGKNDFEISAQYPVAAFGTPTLSTNIMLYEMSPHMHLRGSRFRYEVIYPNGTREVLLSVPNYIFHWQRLYRLAQPKYIPRGSRILCIGAWDNSPQNHDNPDPNASVYWGNQTYDEMFIGYFNFAELP